MPAFVFGMQPSVMRKEHDQTETTMGTSGGLCRASSVTAPSEDQRTGVKITAAYPGEDHFSHSVSVDDQWHLRSRHVETREKELRKTGVRTGASKSVSIHSNGLISKPGQANFVAGFTTAKRKVDSNGMKSTTKFWSDVIGFTTVIYRLQLCNSALAILGLACAIRCNELCSRGYLPLPDEVINGAVDPFVAFPLNSACRMGNIVLWKTGCSILTALLLAVMAVQFKYRMRYESVLSQLRQEMAGSISEQHQHTELLGPLRRAGAYGWLAVELLVCMLHPVAFVAKDFRNEMMGREVTYAEIC
jgi:hypothetical protein